MSPTHILPALKFGASGALVAAFAGVGRLIADAGNNGVDVAGIASGGGGLASAGVLGLVAVKLSRGELVARDTAQAAAALTKLIEQGQEREQQGHDDRQRMFRNEDRMLDALTERKGRT